MSEYPVHPEKVQPPPLRDDILARDRLLDWLGVKINNRVILLTAEAGYGKTTLLADFARRSRLRVLWYRLDRGDRDWVGFIAYLVAAVRIHVPDFGPLTGSLLRETGSSAPPLESVLDTFLRELGSLPVEPAVLVFDDFHLVDDAPDVRRVVTELLTRAPERLTFVFASRRTPPLRLARFRALGEIAELSTDDLRFDVAETERLFRETYSLPLESGLLTELSRRTEGWAASLHLVRSALHDRDAAGTRAFIRSLSGAEGHLYDYLAEEVVGDLSDELQTFLMRTSLLDAVDLDLGPVAAATSVEAATRLMDEGERVGLLGRQAGPSRGLVRAHPLVRDFLQVRLARSIGPDGLAEIHHRIAVAAEPLDWRIAATHYLAAGRPEDARRVLSDSLETILATGAYSAAAAVAARMEPASPNPILEVIASRVLLRRGDSEGAKEHARTAVDLDPPSDVAVWNASMVMLSAGSLNEMEAYADRLGHLRTSPFRKLSAAAVLAGVAASVDGSLDAAERLMLRASDAALAAGQMHFYGVSLLNASQLRRARGDAMTALDYSVRAIDALSETSSGIELVSARLVRAWALAHLNHLREARAELAMSAKDAFRGLEFAFEAADIEALYGDIDRAEELLSAFDADLDSTTDVGEQALITAATIDIVKGRHRQAERRITDLAWGRRSTGVAVEARRHVVRALLSVVTGSSRSSRDIAAGIAIARTQGARLWLSVLNVLEQSLKTDPESVVKVETTYLSMVAEATVGSPALMAARHDEVRDAALARPSRWRPALRRAVSGDRDTIAAGAAELLDVIGEAEDIAPLRALARRSPARVGSTLGRGLARRLAPVVDIDDLGNVEMLVGDRRVAGVDVRRKVLALLCFLLTKPGFRAQREEALDALWPEIEPNAALNSLNQTVYFLRRVFEPDYKEDLSPGYVGQSSDFIWLDPELVESRSARARAAIRRAMQSRAPDEILVAVQEYTGQFANDFLYDDWTVRFRESLHAAYLELVETSLRLDIDGGHFQRGVAVAQAAAEVEPDSETLQLALVRLYRLSGAHAAAAEQYGRYSALMADLGLEAVAIDQVCEAPIGRSAY